MKQSREESKSLPLQFELHRPSIFSTCNSCGVLLVRLATKCRSGRWDTKYWRSSPWKTWAARSSNVQFIVSNVPASFFARLVMKPLVSMSTKCERTHYLSKVLERNEPVPSSSFPWSTPFTVACSHLQLFQKVELRHSLDSTSSFKSLPQEFLPCLFNFSILASCIFDLSNPVYRHFRVYAVWKIMYRQVCCDVTSSQSWRCHTHAKTWTQEGCLGGGQEGMRSLVTCVKPMDWLFLTHVHRTKR